MLTENEREAFAIQIIEEVRRWSGVQMRPHASANADEASDGVEFRVNGRQIGHVHGNCAVHVALTKALKDAIIGEQLAEALEAAPTSSWAMFNPMHPDDVGRATWLLRLNYVRLRRQHLTLGAAATSESLQKHEAAIAAISKNTAQVLQRTQVRSQKRPLPSLDSVSGGDAGSIATA